MIAAEAKEEEAELLLVTPMEKKAQLGKSQVFHNERWRLILSGTDKDMLEKADRLGKNRLYKCFLQSSPLDR